MVEWLELSSEAASAEQMSLVRRAASAADLANAKANKAIAIAIISIVITMIGIAVGVIVPHYWD